MAKDGIVIKSTALTLSSNKKGLVTNQSDKGYILIENGVFDLTTQQNAIEAKGTIEVTGGTYAISTTAKPSKKVSAKALTTKGLVYIANGEFSMNTTDDGINAQNIDINGGSLTLTSGDGAIHSDENLHVNGGHITVSHSREALEGTTIDITGGTLQLMATDDAINAATDLKDITPSLTISNGTLLIQSEGDGIDVNGNFTMTGGEVTIFASPDDQNMVIDYDLNFRLEGGTLVGAGTIGYIGDAPYDAMRTYYKQPTITVPLLGYAPGTSIAFYDSLGNQVAHLTPTVHTAYAIVSSPALVVGENYSILINGQPVVTTQALVSQGI